LKLDKIKNYKDLEKLDDIIGEQGFGYIDKYKMHERKIYNIISNANKHNINYNEYSIKKLIEDQYHDDYDKIKKIIEKFFTKFNINDKLTELLNSMYMVSNTMSTPSSWERDRKDIENWWNFKKKYKITDNKKFGTSEYVSIYDFDKKFLKVHFNNSENIIKQIYKIIFNKDPKYDNYRFPVGIWLDLGEIEIKVFQNNTANIKGNIQKFKDHYLENSRKGKMHETVIIMKDKKQEIVYKKTR